MIVRTSRGVSWHLKNHKGFKQVFDGIRKKELISLFFFSCSIFIAASVEYFAYSALTEAFANGTEANYVVLKLTLCVLGSQMNDKLLKTQESL